MNSEANPVEGRGERNIFCPLYSCCLDRAAKRSWPSWACSQCPKRSVIQPLCDGEIPAGAAVLYYELPREIDRLVP
jgi:hypothetical protein